jgi:hypothetical protein
LNTTKTTSNPAGFQKPTSPHALQHNAKVAEAQVKEASEKVSAAVTTASDLTNKTYASAIKNANDYNAMLVDFTLVNANHAFSFLQKLPRVRSLADFAELSAEHARQQMAAWSNQAQQLTKTIAQKAIPADNSTAR